MDSHFSGNPKVAFIIAKECLRAKDYKKAYDTLKSISKVYPQAQQLLLENRHLFRDFLPEDELKALKREELRHKVDAVKDKVDETLDTSREVYHKGVDWSKEKAQEAREKLRLDERKEQIQHGVEAGLQKSKEAYGKGLEWTKGAASRAQEQLKLDEKKELVQKKLGAGLAKSKQACTKVMTWAEKAKSTITSKVDDLLKKGPKDSEKK